MADDHTITRSSGNVFADAGLPDAHSQLVKAQLVSRIDDIIRARGLSQREAARILDVAQPDLSNLLRGRFRGCSVERLSKKVPAKRFLEPKGHCGASSMIAPAPR